MVAQALRGYHDFQIGLYLQILFGLQLPEYLLFAVLALAVHVVVNQKYVGLLVALVAYFLIIFSSVPRHRAQPARLWQPVRGGPSRTCAASAGPSVRGCGSSSTGRAWALLLAVVARLLWVRGRESGFGTRLHIARLRFTARRTAGDRERVAVTLILTLGGFIFYNTNVLNEYITEDELVERRADYERRYGKYEGIPQPQRTATNLRVEIHPDRRAATIRGSYRLVNRDAVPIDSVHLEPAFYVETRVTFDRPFRQVVVDDEELGHYHLRAGRAAPARRLADAQLRRAARATRFPQQRSPQQRSRAWRSSRTARYFTGGALPVIGYQPLRELWSADDRRKHGLPRQITLAPAW